MRTTPQAVCRVLAIASLIVGGLWSPSLASAAEAPLAPVAPVPAPQSYAGPCTDDLGVTVVVDFQQLGGSTVVRCAPGSNGQPFQGSGLDAFRAAGLDIAGTNRFGSSVVCRVNGRPAADEPLPIPGDDDYTEQCVDMPPAAAFWSYWQADNGGSWVVSQLGVSNSTARAGGFEALSFSLNSTNAPPRTAPSRPTPTQDPEPPPRQDPEPPPSQTPTPPPVTPAPSPSEPGPAPTPAPAPQPPAPSDTPDPGDEPEPTSPGATPTPAPTDAEPRAPGETDDPSGSSTSPGGDDGESATSTQDPTVGDDTEATTSAAPGDASPSTSAPGEGEDPTAGVTPESADPADGGGGATTLWVTVGILLLLGALGFFVSRSRRRRDGADLTHEVEPWQ